MTENVASADDAATQARLRREKREAKIKAGGSVRLNKINGMGGRVTGDSDSTAQTSSTDAGIPPVAAAHADPDEVDISDHYYAPKGSTANGMPQPNLSEAQLRQMMLGMDRPGEQQMPMGMPDMPPGSSPDEHMMKMMQQMMAGASSPGMAPSAAGAAAAQEGPTNDMTWIWTILHGLVALGLGVYMSMLLPFTGTKIQREREAIAAVSGSTLEPLTPPTTSDPSTEKGADLASSNVAGLPDFVEMHRQNFFYMFITAELILLTARFFFDKTKPSSQTFIAKVIMQLPDAVRPFVIIFLRWLKVVMLVRTDLLVCVFVLGVCAWWRS